MGIFKGAHLTEKRIYDNPADPEHSDYKVALDLTIADAVVFPDGETLSQKFGEIDAVLRQLEEAGIGADEIAMPGGGSLADALTAISQTLAAMGLSLSGAYSKPSGGIPASDLAAAARTLLDKAGTALQEESDPTVPAWAKEAQKPEYSASEISLPTATVTALGLTGTKTDNDALLALAALLTAIKNTGGPLQYASGSWVGDNQPVGPGQQKPSMSITFPFEPLVVFIAERDTANQNRVFLFKPMSTVRASFDSASGNFLSITWTATGVSWYSTTFTQGNYNYNFTNTAYIYGAIGRKAL